VEILWKYLNNTGFGPACSLGHLVMILVGWIFLYLGIHKKYEPLLLVPIGVGIILGNIPMAKGMRIGVYEPGSVLYILYNTGIPTGVYPPLIFLGIGAMTDFSALLSRPILVLLGAAAQFGIYVTFIGALALGFNVTDAASIGIIGGADGPTAIFISSMLAPELLGPIAIAAYSYMALVPVIQPPGMKLLTSHAERRIRMADPRPVGRMEKILFPVAGLVICLFIAPGALPLLGMFFAGNLLKESGVTERLAQTARTAFVDVITILIGITVGTSTQADVFLTKRSVLIFVLGAFSFATATAGGVLFAKFLNLFLKNKINPLIGAAGVSAVPDSARVVQHLGREEDPDNHLLMHAMGPNVAGVIGSAIAAGVFYAIFRS